MVSVRMIAMLTSAVWLAAVADDDPLCSGVKPLVVGGVDIAEAESVMEHMDSLYRRNDHKSVFNAYSKICGVALTAGEKARETADTDELVRLYRLAGLMRKYAVTYGQTDKGDEFRRQQDLVVARYADIKAVGDSMCAENAIGAESWALSGRRPLPDRPRPVVSIIPRPAKLRELSGTLTICGIEVSDRIAVCVEDKTLPSEGYGLSVTDKGIKIMSSSAAGRFYAVQTLKQLACMNDDDTMTFPCVEIRDWPRFRWRGVMLDESRHFFGKGSVKRMLDEMAFYKFNIFHWHLTDNHGWRFPVLKRPDITRKCSTRETSKNVADLWDTLEGTAYGPYFYTASDIREVVAYAAARQIQIVPEIDVPGHMSALLKQLLELGCGGKGGDVLCIGNPETFRFLDDVFDSVVELFPGTVVHVGCDEVDKVAWKNCRRCQAFMKDKGIKDENALQAWVISYVAGHLAKKGRIIVGWDELVMDGEIPEGGIIMEWRDGVHGGAAAVKRGHPCVLAPFASSYFVGPQKIGEEFVHYGGPQWYGPALSLEEAYAYDPLVKIPVESRDLVLGGQCCNWTEYTANEAELQWKMWPRAFATAEIYWTPAELRSFEDFKRRAADHRPRLIGRHVNCAPIE